MRQKQVRQSDSASEGHKKRSLNGNKATLLDVPCMAFTESRVEQACRLVAEGVIETDNAGRRSWRDEDCRGLVLTVGQAGGQFYFVAWQGGRTIRKALGTVDAVRLVEARATVGRLRFDKSVAGVVAPRAVKAASAAAAAALARDTSPVFGDVAAACLNAHQAGHWLPGGRSRKPTDRTMQNYRDLFRATCQRSQEPLCVMTLKKFAAAMPASYTAIQARAPVQANRFLQLVRNVYAYAIDAGTWTQPNPAIGSGITRLTRVSELPRTRFLSDSEAAKLDAALAADAPLYQHLFSISLLTAQRMGACARMRWEDVQLTGAPCWRIPAVDMKGRRGGHVVPLVPQAVAILRARRKIVNDSSRWVFPSVNGLPLPAWSKPWLRIIRRAGLWHEDADRRPRPHDLRRTAGARMTAAGVPLSVVCKALGDQPSSVSMVARVYAMVSDEALNDAFSAMSKPRRSR